MKNLIFISTIIISTIFAQDYDTQIQPIWDSNCTSCHIYGHSSGLDLTAGSASIVDVESSGYAGSMLVASGDPSSSVLYNKISGTGTYGGQMPPGELMDASNIALVESWINSLGSTTTMTIAEARALAEDDTATVVGIVTSPNWGGYYTSYTIQDSTAGILIYAPTSNIDPPASLNPGDQVQVSGYIDEYNGLLEIVPGGEDDITVLSTGNAMPDSQVVTVAELLTDGEDYESEIIYIAGVSIASGTWPSEGSSSNLTITDDGSTSEITMRIDSDTDIDGQTQPQDPFNVTAVIGQYNDYQVLPRYYTDFTTGEDVVDPPDLVINEFLAATDLCCDDGYGEMEDFIEIYNPGDEAVDIGGLWITDDLEDTGNWEQIPATDASITTVAAGGHIVIWADKDQDTQGILHTDDIKLSADGEQIGLIFISGTDTIFVDSLSFGEQTDDISYGRYPDGSANWEFFNTPTPGTANQTNPQTVTSIYDIQYVADPSTNDSSSFCLQEVTISGVVTTEFWGGGNSHLYVQDAAGGWNGIIVYQSGGWDEFDFSSPQGTVHSVAEGDSVTLTGTVDEYYGLTQIKDVTQFMIHGPADVMIEPTIVTPGQVMTGGTDAEKFESCLIAVHDVSVDDPDLGYGEWSVTDGTNSVRVDDRWDYYYYPENGDELGEVVGTLDYTYSNFKIQPRLARDVVEADGEPVRLQRIQQVLYSDLMLAGEDQESDMSYMYGDTVTVEGIVTMPTGLSYAGAGIKFIFQDENGGPWSSVLSYDPDSTAFPVLYEGDKIQVTGYVYEYTTGPANMTELFVTEPINILSVGEDLPDVEVVESGDLRWPTEAEQWGNVMVRVEDGSVTGNDYAYEIFEVDDGSGGVLVDDDSDSIEVYFDAVGPPPVGTFISSIEGWVYHHYGDYADSTAYKLCPLYMSDIDFGAGPPVVSEVSRDPCAPSVDNDVTVSAVITDNSDIASAEIMYTIDGSTYQSVSMAEGADDTWSGTIPGNGTDGTVVYYYISATDDGTDQDEPKTSTYPYDMEEDQLGYVVTANLELSIIQYTPWPSGNSLYDDCEVTVTGIITGDTAQYNSGYGAYAMQSESEQWSGVVFDGWEDTELTRGDEVTITGTVEEYDAEWHFKYDNNTKIIDVSSVTVNSTGNSMAAMTVSTEDLEQDADEVESYEGVLVTVSDVTVSSVNSYDWSIVDDSGVECLIDDDMANMAANSFMSDLQEGTTLSSVTGIFNYSFGMYKIQIRDLTDLGQLGIDDDFTGVARQFALHPNYPNPFNPETRIRFELAKTSNVRLMIYDVLGRKVRTLVSDKMDAGHHVVNWNGMNDEGIEAASGMYVYRIKAGDFISHRKMLLVR